MYMGTLGLVSAMYGSTSEHTDVLKFMNWALSAENCEKFKKYDLLPHPQPMSKATHKIGLQGKGSAIRNAFADLNQHISGGSKDDIIIYMDGNQIDFNNCFRVIDFIKNKGKDFVVACRQKSLGISEERGIIEKFENYLLSKRYGLPHLPDAQCGFWGFRGNYLREIAYDLKSETFEIELEIMNHFLRKGIFPAFVGMNIGKPTNTTFSQNHSLPKIIKLSHWLRFNRKTLYQLVDKFHREYGVSLPSMYVALLTDARIYEGDSVQNVELWKEWTKIECDRAESCFEASQEFHPCHAKFNNEIHKKFIMS